LRSAILVDDSRLEAEANINHGEVTGDRNPSNMTVCELIERLTP